MCSHMFHDHYTVLVCLQRSSSQCIVLSPHLPTPPIAHHCCYPQRISLKSHPQLYFMICFWGVAIQICTLLPAINASFIYKTSVISLQDRWVPLYDLYLCVIRMLLFCLRMTYNSHSSWWLVFEHQGQFKSHRGKVNCLCASRKQQLCCIRMPSFFCLNEWSPEPITVNGYIEFV